MDEGAAACADRGEGGAWSSCSVCCASLEELDDKFWFLKEKFCDGSGVVL